MKERLLVLALAAGALGLFYALIFPKPSEPGTIDLPLSSESAPDGYLAVWRWLGEQRIPAVSLRYRYNRLPRLLAHPTGNLLLVTMPQRMPMRADERVPLENWIERGNTLLVVAALDDMPLWSVGADPLLTERLQRITGLEFSEPKAKPSETSNLKSEVKALMTHQLHVVPTGNHALLGAVREVTALSALPLRRWHAHPEGGLVPLQLAARADDGDAAVWLLRVGSGQIILCAAGSVFSNGAIALSDNARLLSNILAWSIAPGGAVIFDDAHQGEVSFYDGRAFFGDPRLHHTLGWLLLLWLAFVLGALPLRVVQRAWEPLDETAYVEGSARYFAAVVPPSDAARRLIEDFLNGLRERLTLQDQSSIWPWLEGQAGVSQAHYRNLQTAYAAACAGERVDLAKLQNLIAELNRNLQ
jgi:Domain of unknown function (DUF4350)